VSKNLACNPSSTELEGIHSHPLPPNYCSLGTGSLGIVVAWNFSRGRSFLSPITAVIYQFNRVPSRLALYSSKYTPIVLNVRLENRECHLIIYGLTKYSVAIGNHIGCTLLNSNTIIFFAYVFLFISETSESKLQAPGCDFALNPSLAAIVVLTLIRAYKNRTCSSPLSYLVNPNYSV